LARFPVKNRPETGASRWRPFSTARSWSKAGAAAVRSARPAAAAWRARALADATKNPGRCPGWRNFREYSFLEDSRYTSQQENAAPTLADGRGMPARRSRGRASAADLKFLHPAPRVRLRNFKSKSGTRTIELLVPFGFRSSYSSVPRCITNFENRALAQALDGDELLPRRGAGG